MESLSTGTSWNGLRLSRTPGKHFLSRITERTSLLFFSTSDTGAPPMRKLFLFLSLSIAAIAQQYDPGAFQEMQWRMIGPFRAGRTIATAALPTQPNVFYMAAVNGGVWRSTDYGRVWTPIFEGQPTQSVGAIAVAPSDPNIIYVGSGEGRRRPDLSVGDGIY